MLILVYVVFFFLFVFIKTLLNFIIIFFPRITFFPPKVGTFKVLESNLKKRGKQEKAICSIAYQANTRNCASLVIPLI